MNDLVSTLIPKFPIDLTWREKLAYLAVKLKDAGGIELPLKHSWDNGQYVREIFIPQGALLIGSPHRHGHRCVLVSGRALHIREHESTERSAPFWMYTAPDCQMVVYAYTDVIGRTYHPDSGERDIEKCRDEHFIPVSEDLAIGQNVMERLSHHSEQLA